jgi:curved DNA-binding protein CbpA
MRIHARTHYDTLSVAEQAAPELVRTAYRRQAQKYHPDRMPGVQAQQLMAQINEAYAVLSDPARRASYDRWIDARNARLMAERAARHEASRSGFAVTWPWYLLGATLAFAALSVGTVIYKSAVPPVARPVAQATPR